MRIGGSLFSSGSPGGSGASPFQGKSTDPSQAPRTLRVLVADDDRDSVLTLMMLLRDEGHEVRGVYTGRQAMDSIRGFDPDVVLLDIALPELSGWEVARNIRSRQGMERPMLIGISGEYKHGSDRILSEIIGFDHYLVKPYAPADLLALLEPLKSPPQEE
jgi:DNA-binding response OmpR family regulator